MIKSIQISLLIVLVIIAVGCTTSSVKPLISTTAVDSVTSIPIDWTNFEDFDVEQYQVSSEASSGKNFHDAPDILLTNDSEFIDPYQEQQGFRIQILATLDKQEADLAYEDALSWWEGFEEKSYVNEGDSWQDPPVYLDFHPPYYRLRVGNFVNRDDAKQLLDVVQRDYLGAFVAPAVILVK